MMPEMICKNYTLHTRAGRNGAIIEYFLTPIMCNGLNCNVALGQLETLSPPTAHQMSGYYCPACAEEMGL